MSTRMSSTRKRRYYRVAERPQCPEHGDSMVAGRSLPEITYYYCMKHDCQHSAKVPRVSIVGNKDAEECE